MRFALRRPGSLALLLSAALLGGRGSPAEAAPDDGRAPARATGPDAAVGFWGGPIGSKLDEGTLDAFRLDVLKTGGGYEAATRADVTLTSKGSTRKVVVTTTYTGRANDADLLFQSTERRRSIDGAPADLLVPASLRVTPKGGHVLARVGNDAEGYTDFTLVPRNGVGAPKTGSPAPTAPSPLAALVGSWGGNMSKADLGSGVYLDEMFVDVSAEGTGVAAVRMNLTLKQDGKDIPLVILARYEHGRADGDAMRWDKVPWHRTVTPTGQKTDIEGNPLVLRSKPGGGVDGIFEGGDGFKFTLAKRAAPVAPEPSPLDALVGSWGGNMSKADLGSSVYLDEMFIEVSAEGSGVAAVQMNLTLKKDGQDIPIVILARHEHGRVDGDAMRWDKAPWHRTVTSTGQKNDLEGNPLVLRRTPDGGLSGKFEGSDGFTFTLARRGAGPGR